MAVFRDFCHKMPVRRNPQKSAILCFALFRLVANLWQKRPSLIIVHDDCVDAILPEFSS